MWRGLRASLSHHARQRVPTRLLATTRNPALHRALGSARSIKTTSFAQSSPALLGSSAVGTVRGFHSAIATRMSAALNLAAADSGPEHDFVQQFVGMDMSAVQQFVGMGICGCNSVFDGSAPG